MNLIQKALLFYKKEGPFNTARRIGEKCWELAAHLPGRLQEKWNLQKYRQQIIQKSEGKQVYLLIPCIDWNIPLFQRPHQLALALAKQENAHVFFVSDEYRYDNFAGIQPVNEKLDLISWRIISQIGAALGVSKKVTVLMSWPRQAHLLEYIPYDTLVYEYIDDISLFYYYTDAMKQKHYDLIREADLTVCTARALYEEALPIAKKAILSPNAGDYAFFHDNRNHPAAPGLLEKTRKYECVLGYYGCLASWFDYELVLEVARKMPQWCFVLVGYCFDGTVSRLRQENLENIILYPAQPYRDLPSFVAVFDVQTIPFVINDITNATSPVKLYEYMATGKPILTSEMPECRKYRSVTTYKDAEDFIHQAKQLMQLRDNAEYCGTMEEEAKENTWDARVNEILNEINGGNLL